MLFAIERGLYKIDVELLFLGKGIVRHPFTVDLFLQNPTKERVAREEEGSVAAGLLDSLL